MSFAFGFGLPHWLPLSGGFSPLSLFGPGIQGTWYDPSDLTTLFQDSAGTTPVTGVEQVVGLMLDKSRGGRQSLPITGWAKSSGDGVVTVDGNTITITGATTTTRVDLSPAGWVIGDYADITVTGSVAGATGQALFLGGGSVYTALSGTNTFRNAIAASTLLRLQINTGSATFVVTSRGYIPGNHATSTGAARPTLRARYNLLTYSEEFDNAAWTKTGTTVNATGILAPNGTITADILTETTANSRHSIEIANAQQQTSVIGCSYTQSWYVKKGNGASAPDWVQLAFLNFTGYANFNIATGQKGLVSGGTSAIEEAANGYWRITFTYTALVASGLSGALAFTNNADAASRFPSYIGNTSADVLIWGAQLLTAADVTATGNAYQRIAAATVYDTSNSVWRPYLAFSGTQAMSTGSIDFTATDKMTVFAGVTKLSDAATAILAELSAVVGATNPGSFAILAPSGAAANNFRFTSSGTAPSSASATSLASPVSAVLTGIGDISGDVSQIRANGAVAGTNTGDQGSGNFGNYPLYIGARNLASLFLNGRLYSLITRGAQSTAAEISATESWVNQKTGAY